MFWLLYIMFVMVSASGLMATAQIAPIAKDFNVGDTIVFWGATTLSAALIIDNVCNGAARPLFGWISDNIGREYTMAMAFGLGGVAYWLLGALGTRRWAFVLFAALIFLTWGEIFSLFPSTCTDTFGPKFATVNLSLLYTAKGTSAFLVPVANLIKARDRKLAHGVRGHRDHEFRGGGLGAVRAQADAGAHDGEGLIRLIYSYRSGARRNPRSLCPIERSEIGSDRKAARGTRVSLCSTRAKAAKCVALALA